MSLLHDSPDAALAEPGIRRFRAATLDDALADARAELGPDVEIVEANRIRRGGVGGFFAADLGVELTVRPGLTAIRRSPGGADLTDFEARLAFYDRVIGQDAPDGDPLERIVARATRADTMTSGAMSAESDAAAEAATEPAAGSRPTATPATTLVQRLARELAEHDATQTLPRATHEPSAPTHRPTAHASSTAEWADRRHEPGEPAPVSRPLTGPGAPAIIDPRGDRTPARDDASPAERTEVVSAMPRAEPAVRATRSAPDAEPGQRPSDLAAIAVGHLVEQLSDVAPVDGSRMNHLSRLTISVTAPDGSRIEMSAELNGSRDG